MNFFSTEIIEGDCREVMRRMIENGEVVDSIVSDPPYHLESIVKRFGKKGAAPAKFGTDGAFSRASRGFMGKQWDGADEEGKRIAFDAETWRLCWELLPPGGWLLAFGGTRTYHRLACAIEDAGFEIRDMIDWIYGSGMPKSHDVSLMFDKKAGVKRPVISQGAPVKRMIPGADQNKVGWEKNNGRVYVPTKTAPVTPEAIEWEGWGTGLKPAQEPICVARKPLEGTVIQNVAKYGTGALNIGGCLVSIDSDADASQLRTMNRGKREKAAGQEGWGWSAKSGDAATVLRPEGRWPANVIHDGSDEVLAAFPAAPGQIAKASTRAGSKTSNVYGDMNRAGETSLEPRRDLGSASRFFYCAKAGKGDRAGSEHPTVKPIALLRYLVRLVTPPGGTVLDPFAGSGTTGAAARAEGFSSVLIERDPAYANDIRHRFGGLARYDSDIEDLVGDSDLDPEDLI